MAATASSRVRPRPSRAGCRGTQRSTRSSRPIGLAPGHRPGSSRLSPFRVRSAAAAGGTAVQARAIPRRRSARVRVPDRHGPIPPDRLSRSRQLRSRSIPRSSLRQADLRCGDSRPHRRAASIRRRGNRRRGRDDSAGDGARRHVRRTDRLRQRSEAGRQRSRCCSKSPPTTDSSPATGRCSARDSSPTAASTRRFAGPIPASGKDAFYDENGRSLKRFFLRSPLKFEPRVTSGFSRNRLHPVFRTYRAHLGVDYAAPPGAPVVAVSSGTVVSAGWSGGGGNMVHLRHASGFESYYLHLSAIAPGIRPSAHVEPGAVDRPRRIHRNGDRSAPRLSAEEERRVRRSARRAPEAAAG